VGKEEDESIVFNFQTVTDAARGGLLGNARWIGRVKVKKR